MEVVPTSIRCKIMGPVWFWSKYFGYPEANSVALVLVIIKKPLRHTFSDIALHISMYLQCYMHPVAVHKNFDVIHPKK